MHRVGSVRFVAAGTVYGPLIAGPEGTTLIDVFADRDGVIPNYGNVGGAEQARAARVREMFLARLDALPSRQRG